jgi:D-glycero-D-manno-heptose 1,7-bisphosphate phosphatase
MFVALDRDGTIIEHVHHLLDQSQIKLIPGAEHSIRKLNDAKIPVVVLTNQSVVGRGLLSLSQLSQLHGFIIEQFGLLGAKIDFFLFCPHIESDYCQCRKPRIGLLSSAAKILNMRISQAIVIGDAESDMEMARRAQALGIHVKTGISKKSQLATASFPSIVEAVNYVIEGARTPHDFNYS